MTLTSYYFLVLDIETSTLYNDASEPTATWLSYGYCNLYDRDGDTWERCYFREWEQLDKFFNYIQQKFMGTKILCFVHNLGYEFDYLIKNLSRSSKFLTNSSHAVISATLEEYPQIEFRCTLRLTMEKLEKIGEMLGFPKLEDDYSLLNPEDTVSEEKKQYCCRDCDIVAKWVSTKFLKEFGSFTKCPLTKTGRVRKTYNKYYNEMVKANGGKPPKWDIEPPEDCYDALNNAFAGGICTSNPMFTGMILHNVKSKDETSAYPFAQLSEEFPYSIEKISNPTTDMLKEKFWIAKIKFNTINSKFTWGWLSVSKMNDYDPLSCRFFNGKLLWGNWVIRTITNVDYESINMTYDYESLEVLEFYRMEDYGELPYPYIATIKEYGELKYNMKRIVKDIPHNAPNYLDMNMKYMLSKNDFNSIYGMTVQKLVHQEYYITDDFEWKEKPVKYECKERHIKRNFLFGVYTTAYARKNWIRGVVENCPITFVYGDTDSIKYIGDINFKDTNKILDEKYLQYDYLKQLGRFEDDGEYEDFVTYGAKKYAYKLKGDSNIYLTVAGLPKYKADEDMKIEYKGQQLARLKSISEFRVGTIFKNCKLGKKYMTIGGTYELTENMELNNVKEIDKETLRYLKKHNIKTNGGVALFPVNYSLDITYIDYKYLMKCREVFNKWVSEVEMEGITTLKDCCGMMLPIELLWGSGQTEKLMRGKSDV